MCIRDVYLKEMEPDEDSPLTMYMAQIDDKRLLVVSGLKLELTVAQYPKESPIPLTTRFWLDILEGAHTEHINNVCSILHIVSHPLQFPPQFETKQWKIKEKRENLCYNWYCFRESNENSNYCEIHQDEEEYENIFGGIEHYERINACKSF